VGAVPAGLVGVKPVVGFDCLLVAGTPVRDLLLCAKHLFFAARVVVFTMLQPLDAVPISPCLARSALPLSIHSPRFLVQLPCA
jgi:hypothetical protein